MKNAAPVSLILCLSIMASCSDYKVISSSLDTAEALMSIRPDSALQLLRSWEEQNISRGSLQARYALLFTQALDKNYLPLSGDSLINTAIDYYSRKKDYRKLSWAYFYQGTCYAQMDSLELALSIYKKVQELLSAYGDDELLTLVASAMGTIYQEQRHYKEALEWLRTSLEASRRSGNLKHENYVLGYIGNVFYLTSAIDSAANYYDQAKALAIEYKDTAYYYRMDISLSMLLREKKQYDKAIVVLTDILRQMQGQHITPIAYYPVLSMLYLDVGHIDSARHYMRLVLLDVEASAKQRAGALAGLKMIEEQAGNLQVAIDYAAQYEALSDSIRHEYYLHDLRIAEEKYRQQRLKEENVKQRTRYAGRVAGICLVSIAGAFMTISWWKKRMVKQDQSMQELRRSYCVNQWNTAIFQKEFDINLLYPTEEIFHAKVIYAAQMAYPGMTEWLIERYPRLNTADRVFSCLLYADWGPKDLCGLYKLSDPDPLYTRRSRLYQKLGIKVDRKKPLLFRDNLMDLYVRDTL